MPEILLHTYTARIKEMIRNDQHDEAIAHCQHILRKYPKQVEIYCLMGEACLEMEMYREAIECFQRTLGADPENLMSRVGLGIILGEQGMLPEAIWQMERAFELAPGNTEVRRELQRLYTQRDSVEKARLKLTPGALGRLYARNGLYERAITEFRSLLRQDPNLPDIRVALAEALWHDGRRLDAVDVCLDLLSMLPNCLKANLILGEIWKRGGNQEAGEEKLNLARALDPENLVAQGMMGKDSPLPTQEVLIPELEVMPTQPWMVPPAAVQETKPWAEKGEPVSETPDRVQQPGGEGQTAVPPVEEARAELEAAIEGATTGGSAEEIPDWLRELGLAGAEAVAVPEAGAQVEQAEVAAVEEVPEWLREFGVAVGPPVAVAGIVTPGEEALPEEAVPEAEVAPAEEVPDWLREVGIAGGEKSVAPPEAEAPVAEVLAPAEAVPEVRVPDSLKALVEAGILDEADLAETMAHMTPEELASQRAEAIPNWLKDLIGEETEPAAEVAAALPEAEIPAEEQPSVAAAVPPEEVVAAEEIPAWLKELGMAETEKAAAPEAQIPAVELPPPEAAVPPEEMVAAEGISAWLKELGMAEVEEATTPVAELLVSEEAVSEVEVPESLKALVEAGMMDEADLAEAMAQMTPEELASQRAEPIPDWLQDLIGEAAVPAVEVTAALPAAEVPVVELPPPEAAAPVEEVLAAEEIPAWLKELGMAGVEKAAAPEAEFPVVELPPPEAAAPVEEVVAAEEIPAWLKELGMAEVEKAAAPEAEFPVVEAPPVEAAAPAEEVAAAEEIPDWLKELVMAKGEEAVAPEAEIPAVALPPLEAAAPVEEMVAAEEIPAWLKELGMAEVEKAVAPEAEIPAVELPPLEAAVPPEEVVAPEEIPAWLKELGMAEVEEVAAPVAEAPVPEEVVSEVEVPESLRALVEAGMVDEADLAEAMAQMTPEELASQRAEAVPNWLKDLIGEATEPAVEATAALPVAEIPVEELPLEAAVPVEAAVAAEEIPAWLKELGMADVEEAVAAQEIPDWLKELGTAGVEKEAAPEVEIPVVEPPLPEMAAPVELPVEGVVRGSVVEAAPEVVFAVEEVALAPVAEVAKEEAVPIVEEVALAPVAEVVKEEAVPVVEEVAPPSQLDDLLKQLKARPRDYQLQLELARLYLGQHDWNAAFKYYEKLVASRRLVPAVIDDLQQPLAGTDVDLVRLYQLLGDAYMHEDRLDEALGMYRLARQALAR